MPWLSRVVSVLVGAVVVALAFLLLRANMPATHVGQRFTAFALFRDGSRLATGSPVMIAGVRIGEVTKLSLEDGMARVDFALRDNVDIPADSWITKRAESAFGDSYLEIIPTDTAGPRLQSGQQLTHVIEGASTDAVLRGIARAMPKIDEGLARVHDFSLSGRRWMDGTFEHRLEAADQWVAAGHLESPIERADRAMATLEARTTRAAEVIAEAKPKVGPTLDRIDGYIARTRRGMADVKRQLHDGLADARDGMDRIDPTLDQLSDVMAAVDEGRGDDFKGKLGRLVNNGDLADTIEDTTDSLASAASTLSRFRSWIGLRVEYDFFTAQPNYYVTAQLESRNDRFYYLELEKGVGGGISEDQLHNVANSSSFNRSQYLVEQLRLTLQLGKRFGWLQLRGGLKESEFGIGADALFRNGKLRFSVDAYNDSLATTPDVKLTAAYEVLHSIYIVGGVSDVFTKPGYLPIEIGNSPEPTYFNSIRYGRDYFLGATLQFTDADLMSIVRIYGAMLVGLALGSG